MGISIGHPSRRSVITGALAAGAAGLANAQSFDFEPNQRYPDPAVQVLDTSFTNLWCGWGSTGAADSIAADLDGVMVFNPSGKPIAHIRLPERCPNLVFGGPKRNRLFMASSHSVYSPYVETRGI